MKHARADYDRIQDPAGLIPEDEPVFLLRGQDLYAPGALRWYADRVEGTGGDPAIVKATREQALRMEAWTYRKEPDMPSVSSPVRPDTRPDRKSEL